MLLLLLLLSNRIDLYLCSHAGIQVREGNAVVVFPPNFTLFEAGIQVREMLLLLLLLSHRI